MKTNSVNINEMHNQHKIKKRFAFTCDEDDRLRELVHKYGEDNWSIIASKMKKRSTRQCRDRWINYLSPLAINGTWTSEEDKLLIEKVETYGRKWKFLTQFFFGRTDINIKNHYNFIQKKFLKKTAELNDNSKILGNHSDPFIPESNVFLSFSPVQHFAPDIPPPLTPSSSPSSEDDTPLQNPNSFFSELFDSTALAVPVAEELMMEYSEFFY